MKKNAMLKIAAILLVAVLLTTCAISSTFAKYVTTGTKGEATARVAKWGITGNTTMTGLFDKTYTVDDGKAIAAETIVAPGTSKTASLVTSVDANVAKAAEVSYKVSYTADLKLENFMVDGEFYCPVVFTVDGAEIKQDTKNNTAALLEKAVEDAIAGLNGGTGTPAEAGGTFTPNAVNIGWSWDFSTSADNDENDTALGNAATAAKITLTVTPTFTQYGPLD